MPKDGRHIVRQDVSNCLTSQSPAQQYNVRGMLSMALQRKLRLPFQLWLGALLQLDVAAPAHSPAELPPAQADAVPGLQSPEIMAV